MLTRLSVVFGIAMLVGAPVHAQETWTTLPNVPLTQSTEDKPQSKAWFHGHTWWTVLATDGVAPGGTWLLRLEPDNTWAFALQVSSSSGSRADVKVVGDVAHVLLNHSSPELVSIEYVPALGTYQLWSERPTPTSVYVGETGTIDMDSTGRLWLGTEFNTDVEVYYSDYPYTSFSAPIVVASGISSDDIAGVIALPNNTVGVFWSNQITKLFGFRVHEDGTDPTIWLDDEAPASQSAVDDGIGMAEDHFNLAVAPDGTLYVAVKTGFSHASLPTTGLLVRRPDAVGPGGTWDDLYFVDGGGTRPIVVLNEDKETIRVFYTSADSIVFRESPASTIDFGPVQTPIAGGGFNDVTSAKDAWTGRLLILASGNPDALGTVARGVVMTMDPGLVGYWKMDEGGGMQLRDWSGWGNQADVVGDAMWTPSVNKLAFDLDGTNHAVVSDQAMLDATTALTLSAWIQPAADADQAVISRALTGLIDGYTLGLSSSSSPTAPGTAFMRFNQATSGELFQVNSTSLYPANGHVWMHVAATFDGTTMRMYVNGAEEVAVPGPVSIAAHAVDFGIGAEGDGTNPFHGALDEVKVYNRALTPSEIAALAASIPEESDLAIAKDDFISSANLGQAISYSIVATNFGPSDVMGARVSDVIPAQLTDVTWTCVPAGGATCTPAGVDDIDDVVDLPVGGSVSYTLNATVAGSASGSITNTATIRASQINDFVGDNNSATDTDFIPTVFEAYFDGGADGFTYADDLFRGTNEPEYARGVLLESGGVSGGALQVIIGGKDSQLIQNMSGGWYHEFTLESEAPVVVSFWYNLEVTLDYEDDEFGQMLASVDGVLYGVAPNDYVAEVGWTGPFATGWQSVQLNFGTLSAGPHVLALGGYNNQKTRYNEITYVLIDEVILTAGAASPAPPNITTQPSDLTVTEPDAAAFTVVATGDGPPTYQWRRDGIEIPGATASTYMLDPTSVAADNGAQFDVVVSNAAGDLASAIATLTVMPAPVPPGITTEPGSLTVTEPDAAAFTVVADGDAPLAYQWRRGGVDIPGANAATYVLDPTDAIADNGAQFDVVVSNGAGQVTSALVTLTVDAAPQAPSISTQPGDLAVTEPDAAAFTVVATGDAPLSYQWRRGGIDIPGANAATYILDPTSVAADSGAQFDVVVSNAVGDATSALATLTVNPAPVPPGITTQPGDLTVTEPDAAAFTVVATGDAPLSYQWRRNGIDIPGANTATYVLDPTTAATDNGAQFDVVVSNAAGEVTSDLATLTVDPAPVPPSITTQPADLMVTEPDAAAFTVVATGDAPLMYQWRRGGIDIPGANAAMYVLDPTSVAADNGAQFDVVVSNGAGEATSVLVTLTVNAAPVPPSITTQPDDLTVTEPAAADFTVVATGDAPLAYQWRRGGFEIPGANAATYVLSPTTVGDNGAQFDVVVSNAAGEATSVLVTLTVNPAPVPPSIITQPDDLTVTEPDAATFSVVAAGDAPLSYRWRRDGVDIPGATAATYVLDPTGAADNGVEFDVVVSNPVGDATSATAMLTVILSGGGDVNKTLVSPATPVPNAAVYDDGLRRSETAVAVWIAPDPNDSLLFVSQKKGDVVDVWNIQTNQIVQTLTGFDKPLGVAVDRHEAAVYVTNEHGEAIFKYLIADILNGNLTPSLVFGSGVSPSGEPLGITVYHGSGGVSTVYVTYSGSSEKFVRAFDTSGVLQHSWSVGSIGVNSIAADDDNHLIYIADKSNNQVKVYQLDGTFVQDFGQANFGADSDVDGLAFYRCGSDGYIIASDQKLHQFEVFDRLTRDHLATFSIANAEKTVGVAIAQGALPGYPNGAMFVQSDDRLVLGVQWDALAAATGASTCALPD